MRNAYAIKTLLGMFGLIFGVSPALPAGQNIGSSGDENVDAALAALHTTYDVSRRRADLSRALHQLAEDVPAIVVDGRENTPSRCSTTCWTSTSSAPTCARSPRHEP
jgi:hypothetical protein